MYQERMIGYYPNIIAAIKEFQAIITAESPEFESYNIGRDDVLENAYLPTMNENRIEQWEHILGITPMGNSTVQDRRDTIIARIRGQGKLNTALINSIVHAFTGGTANAWVKDSTLYVEITPPPTAKAYQFDNVRQELAKKVPAHLGFQVSRNYFTWGDIYNNFDSWGGVNTDLSTWEDVYLYVPFST